MTEDRLRDHPYEVQERAAIMEYDGKLTREQAEELALGEYRRLYHDGDGVIRENNQPQRRDASERPSGGAGSEDQQ